MLVSASVAQFFKMLELRLFALSKMPLKFPGWVFLLFHQGQWIPKESHPLVA